MGVVSGLQKGVKEKLKEGVWYTSKYLENGLYLGAETKPVFLRHQKNLIFTKKSPEQIAADRTQKLEVDKHKKYQMR